eukprot:1159952-Pelagomonas_calceolata.AAC.3
MQCEVSRMQPQPSTVGAGGCASGPWTESMRDGHSVKSKRGLNLTQGYQFQPLHQAKGLLLFH